MLIVHYIADDELQNVRQPRLLFTAYVPVNAYSKHSISFYASSGAMSIKSRYTQDAKAYSICARVMVAFICTRSRHHFHVPFLRFCLYQFN